MNTDALARHYAALTPRERYPLMVAARARGDEVEAERLTRLAPTGTFRVPNFRGLAETMAHLALLHIIQLLDAAAQMWQLESLLEEPDRGSAPGGPSLEQRLEFLVRLWTYLFQVETEAWARFCAELHLDADALIRDLPGYPTVKRAEAGVQLWAFTEEEAAVAVRRQWGDAEHLPAVETALADFRAALASQESIWA